MVVDLEMLVSGDGTLDLEMPLGLLEMLAKGHKTLRF